MPASTFDRLTRNYFAQAPFECDRRQLDTKVDYNVNSKFNLAAPSASCWTSVPTVFGDEAVGRPIGGSSNPGHGSGNTYRLTRRSTCLAARRPPIM